MVKQFITNLTCTNWGKKIQKDELIQLHSFLVQLRNNLEDMINPEANHFLTYDLLEINPHEVYRSKREQELAVFELGKGISCLIKEKYPSALERLCEKFEEICSKLREK